MTYTPHILSVPCKYETAVEKVLLASIKEHVELVGSEVASRLLNLAPSGIKRLLWQTTIELSDGVRIVSLLGLDVHAIVCSVK